jgi:hypothetical protein
MNKKTILLLILAVTFILAVSFTAAARDSELPPRPALLIPMDHTQADHLRAYGLTYWSLLPQQGRQAEWLLNYRGGSFLLAPDENIISRAKIMGVTYKKVDAVDVANIYKEIDGANMDTVLLEKAPKIGVYTPPNRNPWDDAVTLVLEYAQVEYTKLWDEEVLDGILNDYDWLHLHHEDFTGQYGKFYASYRMAPWYIAQVRLFEDRAAKAGFQTVAKHKRAVAENISRYVENGGFLFAMCSATDTLDIALSAHDVDIVPVQFDHTPVDPDCRNKLDYSRTLAFSNFNLILDPMEYEFSDIDVGVTPTQRTGEVVDPFVLFDFAAKYDPVPTMLTQCHKAAIPDFLGQTSYFRRDVIKSHIVILGDMQNTNKVKYIFGTKGAGNFAFLAGHDPEDYRHLVGDPPTDLSLHKNSAAYRLILNNILFPAAKKKERKT